MTMVGTSADALERRGATITPFLWFDDNLEEALELYRSVFDDFTPGEVQRSGDAGPVMTATFGIGGQQFIALNGGPHHHFTEAVSFVISCRDQAEVDHYWDRLSEGGSKNRCGWLKDRFGLSWQVVPAVLPELLGDPDPERAQRVMTAMLQMDKLDIAILRAARDGTA